jgi:hypothetical protein
MVRKTFLMTIPLVCRSTGENLVADRILVDSTSFSRRFLCGGPARRRPLGSGGRDA